MSKKIFRLGFALCVLWSALSGAQEISGNAGVPTGPSDKNANLMERPKVQGTGAVVIKDKAIDLKTEYVTRLAFQHTRDGIAIELYDKCSQLKGILLGGDQKEALHEDIQEKNVTVNFRTPECNDSAQGHCLCRCEPGFEAKALHAYPNADNYFAVCLKTVINKEKN